jgi:hypothetical protein
MSCGTAVGIVAIGVTVTGAGIVAIGVTVTGAGITAIITAGGAVTTGAEPNTRLARPVRRALRRPFCAAR